MILIQAGRVKVNGQVVTEPSFAVTGAEDVEADGRKVSGKKFDYILLNKPAGYVTTKEDRFASKLVMDLLPADLRHVHPVGRLDKDTEGLLLLTNDGDLTHKLTHPSHEIDKVYWVKAGGHLLPVEKQRLEKGIVIEGRKTAPARIAEIKVVGTSTEFLMTIHEGHKRQIRLMLAALRHPVLALKRMAQGPIILGSLKTGAWRRLTGEEVERLKDMQ